MRCPDHPEEIVRKARNSVYWCDRCGAWLIKKLQYTTKARAAKVGGPKEWRLNK